MVLQMTATKNIMKNGRIFQITVQNFDNWRLWIRKNKCIAQFNKKEDDIDKIYLNAKDLSEPRYDFLIEKRENAGIKHLMIKKHLLSVQIVWMMFMKILMSIIQKKKKI